MLPITFSWDDKKNEANKKKHNISFEEAQTIFFDENAIEFFDPDHLRIISARKATKKEQNVNLINLYLMDCVRSERKISLKWAS